MSLLLIILAAFCNAVMDLLENENFHGSIFRSWNPRFWYKRVSWMHARKIFGYKIDGWHLAKSAMITCWLSFVVWEVLRLDLPVSPYYIGLYIALIGMSWNLSFELSYQLMKNKRIIALIETLQKNLKNHEYAIIK